MYKSPTGKTKYLEQWERVKRFYVKIQNLDKGGANLNDDECLDDVYGFFIHCFHLKDWINNSISTATTPSVEELFDKNTGNENFKICADFANGSKHLKIKKKVRVDPNTGIATQSVTVFPSAIRIGINSPKKETVSITRARYSWNIKAGGKDYDVYDLAKNCMDEWEKFLRDNNLI